MKVVRVEVEPAYEVVIGEGGIASLAQRVHEDNVAVITDDQVGPHYASRLAGELSSRSGRRVEQMQVGAGEGSKSLEVYSQVLRRLAQMGLGRDCAVVALGGGVVSDLAGFVAASYLRGVSFYACPTSLLAMVDASVGGKTGVNLPEGKNLVGAFWQPAAVFADVSTLSTLSPDQFRDGAVELLKAGLLARPQLLDAIFDTDFRPDGPADSLEKYIASAVEVKAEIVAADERESSSRAYLNLGHTLAHALERVTSHSLSHGAAVAYGLVYAALLGRDRGWVDFSDKALAILRWLDPPPLPKLTFEEVETYMLRDKKSIGNRLRFVLLRELGEPELVADVTQAQQRSAWQQLQEVNG